MSTVPRWRVVCSVMALASAVTGCGSQLVYDPFYDVGATGAGATPSVKRQTERPGDVVASRPGLFTLDPVTLNPVPGVRSWQITYRSTTGRGAAVVVSGTVLVPTTAWQGAGHRPLISYGVGTRGLGDQCAPSKTLASGTDYEGGIIGEALARGWAVAVSDMIGLGTPGTHTYEVGRDQGTVLLDIARAAQHLPGTGLDSSTPIGLWGYSQGGTSAGWAAQLAPTYAPELNVAAVAAGGVPADLGAVAANLDGNAFFSLLTLAAVGYDAAYPDLQLAGYLSDNGRRLLADEENFCIASLPGIQTFMSLAGHHMSEYFTTVNPLTTPAWIAALDENKLGAAAPTAPVLMLHALFDEVVPREQAVTLRRQWCGLGANVTWGDLFGEHALGLAASTQPALDFLAARFAGIPTGGTCSSAWPT